MASRYDSKYDWRGIAMLTQQLGQLFEPSKARLMSQQHEHEMHMLMAKQAWDTQSKEVTQLKTEYDALQTDINTYEEKLYGKDLKELIVASSTDGANAEQSAEVLDKTGGKYLSGLHESARKYEEMIRQGNVVLDNYQLYNAEAKGGEAFSKRMTSRPGAKEQKEYNVLAESDGIPGLSYKEKQKALNMYIKDAGIVLKEDDKDYSTGMNVQVWDGAKYEDLIVKPEGFAFISGYNSTINKEARSEKKGKNIASIIEAKSDQFKMVNYDDMDPKKLAGIYNQTQSTLNTLNDKYDPDKDWKYSSIAEALSYTEDGVYVLHQEAKNYDKILPQDLDAYVSARNNATLSAKAMSKKGMPVHQPLSLLGIKETPDMTKDFNAAIPGVELNVGRMYKQLIESDSKKKGYADTVNTYNDFLRNYGDYPVSLRLQFIRDLNDWLAK